MSLTLIAVSFVAGVLTILAPCVLPLLPVIIGVSAKTDDNHSNHKPLLIIGSFATSVILFSLLINWASKQFGIYQEDIIFVAGIILVVFGVLLLFPGAWSWFMEVTWIERKTWELASQKKKGIWWDIFIGVVLGPLLQSCSPTYWILIATILPGNFLWGLVNILAYVLGLALMLLVLIYGWRSLMKKIRWAVNPHWWFKRIVAVIIIAMWVLIITGLDKKLSLWLVESGLAIDTTMFEYNILSGVDLDDSK